MSGVTNYMGGPVRIKDKAVGGASAAASSYAWTVEDDGVPELTRQRLEKWIAGIERAGRDGDYAIHASLHAVNADAAYEDDG